jgi:hypothetical protein
MLPAPIEPFLIFSGEPEPQALLHYLKQSWGPLLKEISGLHVGTLGEQHADMTRHREPADYLIDQRLGTTLVEDIGHTAGKDYGALATFGRSILRNASLTSDIRGTNHYDRDAL